MEKTGWRLLVHGGAGMFERHLLTPEDDRTVRAALDAVEAAVKALEDDPNFNAGRGSVFTFDGTNEMDAAIMDGRARAAGSVTRVVATKNPVSLARAVMELSPHVMLSGEGADRFSREQGLEQAGPEWFALDWRRAQLEEVRASPGAWFDEEMKYGTVGAVAVDVHGHVAAATSTGGLTGKRWGRIGDTPLIGAGTYADDRSGAVSATGAGEYFIRAVAAHEICARMRMLGESARVAADRAIAEIGALGGSGGVILVTPAGDAAWAFNTPGMYRGIASAEGRRVAIYADE